MEILDDITDITCDRCQNHILSTKEINKGYIYRAESQKTPLFSNTMKYKVRPEPYEFIICQKCNQQNLIQQILITFGFLVIGVLLMYLPLGDIAFYIGCGCLFIFFIILPETAFRKKRRMDEMSVKLYKKKYPEDYALKSTVPLTRKAYSEMYPDASVAIQDTIKKIQISNQEMIEVMEKLKQNNDGQSN